MYLQWARWVEKFHTYGAIEVSRNTVGGGRVSDFPEKHVTKIGSTVLALRGGGCQISRKKRYVTLEWPLYILVMS